MVKYLFLLLGIVLSVQACAQNNKSVKELEKRLLAVKDSLPTYPVEKQITYIAHLNSKTPYELYLDDILIDWEREDNFSKSVELNPYLLGNGTHKLKIRFFPPENSEDGLIKPKDIVYDQDVKWNLYFIKLQKDPNDPLGYAGSIDYRNSELPIVAPPTEVPVWEQEFEVEVKDLPYQLKGWSEGEDLSKLDPKELEKEVVAYYNQLRNLLNKGEITKYMQLNKTKHYEVSVSIYDTPQQYEKDYYDNVDLLSQECIGNMLPITNYTVKLYAKGKIAALEIPEGKYRHWSVLFSDSKKYGQSEWGIKVYRPQGSKEFVIIRK
ncbi:hypothetical protein ETU08_03950 [Apibacter muscae]|uniref:hypothetical protein n=1 Tax=Apibacter muscae TaxID=2509004 RepID=UPI0011ABE51A|nr:hypothetical protein [Apibacter muscae]TWP30752.1 hypothetical protein ETU08_03950 [Apibacter muscae]